MVDLATILAGLSDAFTLWNLAFVIFGVTLGQLVAAIPGIGPVMAMVIVTRFLARVLNVIVVAMRMVLMVFAGVILMVNIPMLKNRRGAVRQNLRAARAKQFNHFGVRGEIVDGSLQPRRQRFADPENDLRILQRPRLGRAQRVVMRRRFDLDQKVRGADALHHLRGDGMNRPDIGRNTRRGQRRGGEKQGGGKIWAHRASLNLCRQRRLICVIT